ncbi:MAG: cytochrome c3 family protein [Candidatus Thiodiazotropha sp.]
MQKPIPHLSRLNQRLSWLVLIHTALLLTILSFESFAARVVAEKRECATCHIAWMADFKRDDVLTLIPNNPRPEEKTGRQDIVSTERMCFSCHDGFVLDSRFLWQEGHNHPVGVKPSDKVKIPTEEGKMIFPLNDAGNIYCGTCHSAHGIEWGDQLSPVFLRARNIDSSLCIMCHGDRKEDKQGQHNHPILKEAPADAQRLLEQGAQFGQDNKVICQSCHRIHSAAEDKLLVKNNRSSQLCSTCHTDKVPQHTPNARHFTHPVNTIPRSATLPEIFFDADSKLGPNREIICETCHQVHHAASEKLVILEQASLEDGICVTCHKDKRDILNNGHNMFISRKRQVKEVNTSQILGACGTCHNIHGGNGPKMWAKKLDSYGDRTASLCLSCHKKGRLAEDFTIGKHSHPVGKTLPKGADISSELPLFNPAGERTTSQKFGRVSCPTCHDIHAKQSGGNKSLFFANDSSNSGKYLRIGEQDRLILCKNCHQDKWSITETKHNIEAQKESGSSSNLGVCGSCHLVHNGQGPRIWARDNLSNDAPTTSLCLNCHTKGSLAEDKTIGEHSHPIDISIEAADIQVTDDGWIDKKGSSEVPLPATLPLYDKTGHKQANGELVGCGTCHDPHRWSATDTNSSTSNKDEEGDSTTSFLRKAAAPNGQLCSICHRSKATIRATDHDMAVTAPKTSNNLQANPAQSGVCGQCHAVHNATQALALWARTPGPGRDVAEKLCRSCHSNGKVAEAKDPKKAHHPSYVRAWSSELRKSINPDAETIPMFSTSGRQSDVGFISCPTCHNAHQWEASKEQMGSGKNEEGDVLSSFLRLNSTERFICADCHGLDSIFRYKYFHGANRTPEQ